MKVTRGQVKSIKVSKSFLGHDVLIIDGVKHELRDMSVRIRCINKEQYRSVFTVFLVAILCLTVVGIIIAIALWMTTGKRVRATLQIDTATLSGIVAVAETEEWKTISKYVIA